MSTRNHSSFARAVAAIGGEVHSIRLFPKNQGTDAYILTGIASLCDWVVLSDMKEPHVSLRRCKEGDPRVVFLSLRSPFRALRFFHDEVMPQISSGIILISGSEDVTVPRQTDARWPAFSLAERRMIENILADRRVVGWYAENLDHSETRIRPLPTGMVPPPSPGSICFPISAT